MHCALPTVQHLLRPFEPANSMHPSKVTYGNSCLGLIFTLRKPLVLLWNRYFVTGKPNGTSCTICESRSSSTIVFLNNRRELKENRLPSQQK
jgi:hypothetical protein